MLEKQVSKTYLYDLNRRKNVFNRLAIRTDYICLVEWVMLFSSMISAARYEKFNENFCEEISSIKIYDFSERIGRMKHSLMIKPKTLFVPQIKPKSLVYVFISHKLSS